MAVKLKTAREVIVEYTENISRDGLFVRSEEPLPVGTPVELELNLPYRATPMTVQGAVVRVIAPGSFETRTSSPGMAISLQQGRTEIRNELQAFLAGFRAGLTQSVETLRPQRVMFIGVAEQLVPLHHDLLRRTSLSCHSSATVQDAAPLLRRMEPEVLVVSGQQLDKDPASLLSLVALSPSVQVLVLGGHPPLVPERVQHLPKPTADKVATALAQLLLVRRRLHPRAALHSLVSVQRADGRGSARLEDVSLGGIGFSGDLACAVDERIEVEFALPGLSTVKAKAAVRRVRRLDGKGFFTGASFLGLHPDSAEELRTFLSRKLA
jgi:uncharacterized protein (TIGR02266 family)